MMMERVFAIKNVIRLCCEVGFVKGRPTRMRSSSYSRLENLGK